MSFNKIQFEHESAEDFAKRCENKCDHIIAIDQQIPIVNLSDNFIWNNEPDYFCKFCPECGKKLREPE